MGRLRIMTANLLVDRADPGALAAVLEAAEPDVLVVQELGSQCAPVIEDAFAHPYLDPQEDGFGLGIAATRPIVASRLAMPLRPGWVAHLEPAAWPGLDTQVTVFGVHLTNPVSRPFKLALDQRREQFDVLDRETAKAVNPYVVIGDMNSSPVWPGYRRLTGLGTDAARASGTRKRTWNQLTTGPRLLRIDHAIVNGLEPESTHTHSIRGTDHDALIVDLIS